MPPHPDLDVVGVERYLIRVVGEENPLVYRSADCYTAREQLLIQRIADDRIAAGDQADRVTACTSLIVTAGARLLQAVVAFRSRRRLAECDVTLPDTVSLLRDAMLEYLARRGVLQDFVKTRAVRITPPDAPIVLEEAEGILHGDISDEVSRSLWHKAPLLDLPASDANHSTWHLPFLLQLAPAYWLNHVAVVEDEDRLSHLRTTQRQGFGRNHRNMDVGFRLRSSRHAVAPLRTRPLRTLRTGAESIFTGAFVTSTTTLTFRLHERSLRR